MSTLVMANPAKKRKTARKSPRRRTTAKRRTSRRRVRRNPINTRSVMNQGKKAAIGAAGALAVDYAFTKLPIPDQYKSGNFVPLVRGAIGIGIGYLVDKFLKKPAIGAQLTEGAMTVALYSTGKGLIAEHAPDVAANMNGPLFDWDQDINSMSYINDFNQQAGGGLAYINSGETVEVPDGLI